MAEKFHLNFHQTMEKCTINSSKFKALVDNKLNMNPHLL